MTRVATTGPIVIRAALAAAFVVVGGHEAFVVGDTSARVWGWAMMAIGLMLVAGVVFPRRAWGAVGGLIGSAAAAVVAGYVMYAACASPDPARRETLALSAVTIGVALVSGGALVAAIARDRALREACLSAKPLIASVASVGTLLTAGQFLQDSYAAEGSDSVSLVLSVDLAPVPSPRPDLFAYALTVDARNVSETTVGTLGSACTVIGRRIRALPARLDRSFDLQTGTQGATEPLLRYRGRAAREVYAEPVYSEPFLGSFGFYFEAGEEATTRRTVLVRPGEHDLYEAVCEVVVTRGARLAGVAQGPGAHTETFSWSGGVAGSTVGFGTTHVTRTAAEIPEPSWLRGVTRRERTIVAMTQVPEESPFVASAFTPLVVLVDGAGRPDRESGLADYHERVAPEYGLTATSSRASVTAPPAPRRRTRPLSDVLRAELKAALGGAVVQPLQEPLHAVADGTEYALWYLDELDGRRLVAFRRRPDQAWERLPSGCAGVPSGLLRAWGVLRSDDDPFAAPRCIGFDGPPAAASAESARLLAGADEDARPLALNRPQHFVLTMHAAGDRTARTVVGRLAGAGYAGGAVLDQDDGSVLSSTFAIALRDEEAARREAATQSREFLMGDLAGAWTLPVEGVPGAIGMRCEWFGGRYFDLVLVPRGRMLIGVMARWAGDDGTRSAELAAALAERAAADA